MSKGTNKVKEKSCFAKWIPANESNIRLLIRNTLLLHKRKWRLTSRVDHEKLETCRATTRWAKTLVHLGHFSSFTAGKTKTWLRCQSAHLNLSRLFEDNYCFEQRQQTFSHLVCEMLGVCVCMCVCVNTLMGAKCICPSGTHVCVLLQMLTSVSVRLVCVLLVRRAGTLLAASSVSARVD